MRLIFTAAVIIISAIAIGSCASTADIQSAGKKEEGIVSNDVNVSKTGEPAAEQIMTYFLDGKLLDANGNIISDKSFNLRLNPDIDFISVNSGMFNYQRHDKGQYRLEVYTSDSKFVFEKYINLINERTNWDLEIPADIYPPASKDSTIIITPDVVTKPVLK